MAKQTVPPLPLPKGWPTRVCPASRGQLLRAIRRGPYLILPASFLLRRLRPLFLISRWSKCPKTRHALSVGQYTGVN